MYRLFDFLPSANGYKVRLVLKQLHIPYELVQIDITKGASRTPEFLAMNPNGRIPTIIDNTKNHPHPVMETSAELLYLVSAYDKDGFLTFDDPLEYSQMLQWLFFWHGSGAPYQSQLGFFSRATEKVPFAIERFRKETLRVF